MKWLPVPRSQMVKMVTPSESRVPLDQAVKAIHKMIFPNLNLSFWWS